MFRVIRPSAEDQLLKSADEWYSRIFRNKIKTEDVLDEIKKKKQEVYKLWFTVGEWAVEHVVYIWMYKNAAAKSAMLVILDMIFITILKFKHKLYIASDSVPPPLSKNFWLRTWDYGIK